MMLIADLHTSIGGHWYSIPGVNWHLAPIFEPQGQEFFSFWLAGVETIDTILDTILVSIYCPGEGLFPDFCTRVCHYGL